MNFRGCGGTYQNLSFGTDFNGGGMLSKVDISRRCGLSKVDTFGSGLARTVDVYFHPGALAY